MDSGAKIEERKAWNAHFLKAFQYLLDEGFASTKGELCALVGIQAGLLSKYANGLKKPSVDTMNALVRVSEDTININYLLNKSHYMLVANVPEDEDAHNPDRAVIERHNATKAPALPDYSSVMNAALAAKDELIESKKKEIERLIEQHQRELAEKDARIADLQQLADERLHRISELRRLLDAADISESLGHFPVGVAESKIK